MEKEYSSYKMNDNIRIIVDNNSDDLKNHGFHCHVFKANRGKRVASIILTPYCRFVDKVNKDDLNFTEQSKVLKYCESIKNQLIKDCETVLNKK